ncbi:MAG TPA: chemotaxis protein CheW [Tepidisphaeraceae bacterium]|nr:chemotaxis protein CheW [Tepidisphaeraceae bacterium]
MTHTVNATTGSTGAGKGGKYLTFALGKEQYGLAILKVRELIGYMDLTCVPRMPAHVKGVINLRGQVISVIDLRTKFGMEPVARTEETCIIIVEIEDNGRRMPCGLIVDRVSEVLNITNESIEDPPSLGKSVRMDFIVGMGKVGETVKILLDIDKVLSNADVVAMGEVLNNTAKAA